MEIGNITKLTLDEGEVETLFVACSNQDDILVGLYKMVVKEWDEVDYVLEGKPHIGVQGWHKIHSLFQKFDELHCEDVFPGCLWLSLGFQKDEKLNAWDVDTSDMKFMR